MSTARKMVFHHFTVDVEEYFQVSALEPYVSRSQWDAMPRRLEVGVHKLLDLLDEYDSRGSFFVLGCVAEQAPKVIEEISTRGHEIASHGTDHKRVTTLGRDEFRESVRRSKQILEDITGQAVIGYRAPSFSIVRGLEWTLDMLIEEGYRYDSSLFPVRRAGYGFVGGERDPHWLSLPAGPLYEVPPATLKVGQAVLPAGGGAYFRHLPYILVRAALLSAEHRGSPGTFYIHPWELDPEQPRLRLSPLTRLRHYGGLTRTVPRLKRLLSNFRFQPIARTLSLDNTRPA